MTRPLRKGTERQLRNLKARGMPDQQIALRMDVAIEDVASMWARVQGGPGPGPEPLGPLCPARPQVSSAGPDAGSLTDREIDAGVWGDEYRLWATIERLRTERDAALWRVAEAAKE